MSKSVKGHLPEVTFDHCDKRYKSFMQYELTEFMVKRPSSKGGLRKVLRFAFVLKSDSERRERWTQHANGQGNDPIFRPFAPHFLFTLPSSLLI